MRAGILATQGVDNQKRQASRMAETMKAAARECNDHGRIFTQVFFFCPGCETAHAITAGRWTWNGSEDKPTFSPSVLVNGNATMKHPTMPRCHSFVTDGRIQFLSDCDHALAGKTVDLPDVPGWLAE
jgi:uncharacterized protein DUF6527